MLRRSQTRDVILSIQLVLATYRTQLLNPGDLDNVKQVQAGYKMAPLSTFLGQPAPAPAPAIAFIAPLTTARSSRGPGEAARPRTASTRA